MRKLILVAVMIVSFLAGGVDGIAKTTSGRKTAKTSYSKKGTKSRAVSSAPTEAEKEQVINFLRDFYMKYLIGDEYVHPRDVPKDNFTKALIKRLEDIASEGDADPMGTYPAFWELGEGPSGGNTLTSITYEGNNWYKVKFKQNDGDQIQRSIKASVKNGEVIISDYKKR